MTVGKILLLGGTGYVGNRFQALLTRRGVDFQTVSRVQCDYTSPASLEALIRSIRPRAVINAAGYTGRPNVDACELHKTECLLGNAVLPGTLRRVLESHRIAWGHVSSGCIYTGDGPGGRGFSETDPPNFTFRQNNCSFYSGSKALGEELLAGAERCYVWRLRIPFHELDHPRNYLTKLMRYDRLVDASNSLSHIDDAVTACWACFERDLEFGAYNLTNPGWITTRDIVEMIRRSGVCTREFRFFQNEAEFLSTVITPRSHCRLNTEKAESAGIAPCPVVEAIEAALRAWVPQRDVEWSGTASCHSSRFQAERSST